MTVASITQTSATGIFGLTAEPVPNTGATGHRDVTQGVFSVKL